MTAQAGDSAAQLSTGRTFVGAGATATPRSVAGDFFLGEVIYFV
jgi:hypothetical protein